MGSKGTSASSVGLSSAARHLSSLENSDNDVNMERVNQIRDAIASGELKMDPSRIADGLLASVRDLLK
jgi:negative regulator of flagellin synthesis FlgM